MYLTEALNELKCIYSSLETEKFPYFFIVGAGVSCPEIPLASGIIKDCKKKVHETNKEYYEKLCSQLESLSPMDKYSKWFEKAYPSPETRRTYLNNLIEKAKITDSNMQIANILSSRKITNLVVTPNFDDQIEKCLNFLGDFSYYSSNNNLDNIGINLRTNELQIIHVHGTYKTYSFKNLSSEIESVTNSDEVLSMKDLLTNILSSRSPIIIGYSGWENDIIMTCIKKRITQDVPYKYYWICYSKNDYENLPDWLKNNNGINFVIPENTSILDDNVYGDTAKKLLSRGIDLSSLNNENLPSSKVLSNIRTTFKIPSPEIFSDPLNLNEKFLNKFSNLETVYKIDYWIEELKKLKNIHKSNISQIEELYKIFRSNNITKLILKLQKALGKNSSLNDYDFNRVINDILLPTIYNNSISKKDLIRTVRFAMRIPSYRNTSHSIASSIIALSFFIVLNMKKNSLSYFNRIYKIIKSDQNNCIVSLLALFRIKYLLINEHFDDADFLLISNEIDNYPIKIICLEAFPEYIELVGKYSIKANNYDRLISLIKYLTSIKTKDKDILTSILRSLIIIQENQVDKSAISELLSCSKLFIKTYNINLKTYDDFLKSINNIQ